MKTYVPRRLHIVLPVCIMFKIRAFFITPLFARSWLMIGILFTYGKKTLAWPHDFLSSGGEGVYTFNPAKFVSLKCLCKDRTMIGHVYVLSVSIVPLFTNLLLDLRNVIFFKVEVKAHNSSFTLPFFFHWSVCTKTGHWAVIAYVLGVSIVTLYTNLLLDLGNVLTVCYALFLGNVLTVCYALFSGNVLTVCYVLFLWNVLTVCYVLFLWNVLTVCYALFWGNVLTVCYALFLGNVLTVCYALFLGNVLTVCYALFLGNVLTVCYALFLGNVLTVYYALFFISFQQLQSHHQVICM